MQNLVVFSGAGMSAESGIQTFRDHDGLWENYNIEDVATPEAWARNPQLVQDFYNQRRKHILDAQPNLAHQLIAQLQQYYHVNVITQNIDDLHERAGNDNVLHLHGNILLAKSSGPNAEYSTEFYPIQGWELNLEKDHCPAGYPLRPHVVWFGEAVPTYVEAQDTVQHTDIFIVIGSSLEVYPVAGLIHEIPQHCQAYYIDPKAHQQSMPAQYQLIAKTATEGMQQVFSMLTT
ncbi:SIR2 family NAD-dependent protein deacylase [Acinetobacter zhairhuonensis]|uniref:SIR2 family NAD-dependent protein deacylase n=1 Tax=Acinetobacter sp. A7.4 TaxID=2919921 RepID=UPI001F4DD371|nr:Sir2 family NAD-dependent protein deacetylase [Acinetobacter sp. A7.4]MCJ8160682.1 NAD-dependent deacylase [Acinetobacter sp. A7.4]